MSNIYLKITIEKSRRSEKFDFLSLKNLPPGQFLGSSMQLMQISLNFQASFCNSKTRGPGANLLMAFVLF